MSERKNKTVPISIIQSLTLGTQIVNVSENATTNTNSVTKAVNKISNVEKAKEWLHKTNL